MANTRINFYLLSRATALHFYLLGSLITFLFCIMQVTRTFAQNPNNNRLIVVANAQWNWDLNTTTELETNQVISNAVTLNVKSQNSDCRLFARLSNYTYPPGFVPTSCPIFLDYVSHTGNNASNITQLLQLTTSDQLLFNHSHTPSIRYYYYDLVLYPLGYTDYPVGTYYFTITFTMTQP